MAAPFKDFGCASAFNNGSMLSATPQRSKVQQWFKGSMIVHCSFSFAAFSVVARHSSNKLGSALTPKIIANCSLLIVHSLRRSMPSASPRRSKVQQWFKGCAVQSLRRSKVQLVNSASLHFLSSLGIAQASLALHSLLRKLLIVNC
jgi:hypothetical protein